MFARVTRVTPGLLLVVLMACRGSGESDGPGPSKSTQAKQDMAAPPSTPEIETPEIETPEAAAPQDAVDELPTGSCEELSAKWEQAERNLIRACSAKADCSILWSDHNCYTLHGKDDDLRQLKAVDSAMAAQDCPELECEPPPDHACEKGVCDWDL